MPDDKSASNAPAKAAGASDEAYHQLRHMAALGYQLRAAVRAGDRFLAQDNDADRDTGVWLISCAYALAGDVTAEIDGVARNWKPRAGDGALVPAVTALRTRAHQLLAAVRAADHFLDQDSSEDQGTGSWLVACALGLADKLAGETDDLASTLKRNGAGANEPESGSRRGSAQAALRTAPVA